MKGNITAPNDVIDRGSYGYVERTQRDRPRSVLGQMLTVKQAAEVLGISTGALYQRIANGTAPKHYRHKGRVLFREAELREGQT